MQHWEVLAEPIQQVMRKYGLQNPYEQLKEITRGQKITKQIIKDFIATLQLPADVKAELMKLEPKDYIGNAGVIARQL